MAKLIVANTRPEESVGDPALLTESERVAGGRCALTMLWYADEGDVLVLPYEPPAVFLDYVTSLTGTRAGSLAFVVPCDGRLGRDLLTADRLGQLAFVERLAEVIASRQIDEVLASYVDSSVLRLVEALGLESALPGVAFSAQGGDGIVNSKSAFRAIATGLGVAIAPGVVTRSREQAVAFLRAILRAGGAAIVKRDVAGGGLGNEIVSSTADIRPAGTRSVAVLADDDALLLYLDERWSWLTAGGDRQLVIERFYPGCRTIDAEYLVGDRAVSLRGMGEMLMEATFVGKIVPPPRLEPGAHARLVAGGFELCQLFGWLGYRGNVCIDAILAPDGQVYFSEARGRLTGSTHLHAVVRRRLLEGAERTNMDCPGWEVGSFDAALARLRESGLAFDRTTGTGVVLTRDLVPANGTVSYCAIGADLESASALRTRLLAL